MLAMEHSNNVIQMAIDAFIMDQIAIHFIPQNYDRSISNWKNAFRIKDGVLSTNIDILTAVIML
jgi:hypothetical protein